MNLAKILVDMDSDLGMAVEALYEAVTGADVDTTGRLGNTAD